MPRSRAGFTLLELLIALVLLSLLTTALYASYFSVVKARERAVAGMEERRELGATLDLLRREINSTVYNRDDKRLRFVVEDRDNFGKPASNLELTTLAVPQTGQVRPESGIRAVRYEMVEKNKQTILTRREQDLFYDWQTAKPYPQMERISGFLVECYDGSKWVRTWSSLNPNLPAQVRITVQFEEDGKPVEFSVLSTPRIIGRP
ncbi:MAG: prepilin-type N-terminal cleavage/methylation domain-containing protein [Desulfuromonadales bacterium]|nr:prepilin-type N-terminal cleavage/methylation domain-containing protein [Desulfuromonadales bacterium]